MDVELVHHRTIQTNGGPVDVFRQTYQELPVIGPQVVVRRDVDGHELWRDGEPRALEGLTDRALTSEQAVAAVGSHRMALGVEPIVYAVGNRTPRHAYRITYAPSPDRRTQWRVTVDATDGKLMGRENLVRSAKGRVHASNPRQTPELTVVELPTDAPDMLANDRFVMGNCADAGVCEDVHPSMCRLGCERSRPADMNFSEVEGVLAVANLSSFAELDDEVGLDVRAAQNIVDHRETVGEFTTIEELDAVAYVAETAFGKLLSYAYLVGFVVNSQIHFCDMTPRATPDASGDYTHIEPAPDSADDDAFVEVQVFHHVNLVDDTLRSWGFAGLDDQGVQVITNYRGADEYDDASYACIEGLYQGDEPLELVDNAWYAPQQLAGNPALVFGQGPVVDWGLDADIVYHEYGHAVMFTVAPDVGSGTWDEFGYNRTQAGLHEGYADLVAMWLTGDDALFAEYIGLADGSEALRDWSNPVRCPDDMTGEEHDDGLILPSAIWHAREALDARARADFDEATFVVWQTLGADDGLRTVIDRLKLEFAASRPDQAEVASDILDSFVTEDCVSRTVSAWEPKDLAIQGNDSWEIIPHGVPHTLQWRAVVEGDATEITFVVGLVDPFDPANSVDMTLFLKVGDEPIRWFENEEGYVNDADVEVPVEMSEDGVAFADVGIDGGGTYTFALSNRGGSAYLWDTSFDTDGEGAKDDLAARGHDVGEETGGCTSVAGKSPASSWWHGVLLFCGLLLRRSRRIRNSLIR